MLQHNRIYPHKDVACYKIIHFWIVLSIEILGSRISAILKEQEVQETGSVCVVYFTTLWVAKLRSVWM
jgi:hypothetical protein